jgi:hypothetical protein
MSFFIDNPIIYSRVVVTLRTTRPIYLEDSTSDPRTMKGK